MKAQKKKISRRKFLASIALCGIGGFGYARLFEPHWLAIGRHQVQITKEKRLAPLKLLQLSDFHASRVVSIAFIEKAIRLGLEQKPDLICLTGDFITRSYHDVAGYGKVISLLPKAAPTFACLGNHDGGLWASTHHGHQDTKFVRGLLEQAGVTLLHNQTETVQISDWVLTLVGLGDSWADEMQPELAFVQEPNQTSDATIVLSHNPDTKQDLKSYPWDLLLCGHTHGGQIRLPLIGTPFAPVHDKRYVEGLHRWNGRWLHVTRGVGNLHGVRFNCRPEVSLLSLT